MTKQVNFFKSLKVLNIYLKNITFKEGNPNKPIKNLNVVKNIQISHKEANNVSYILEEKITTNNGEKNEITVKIGIDIKIELNENVKIDDVNEKLEKIAERIVNVNYIDNKISLLVGNITSSFGENPIIFPTDTFTKIED